MTSVFPFFFHCEVNPKPFIVNIIIYEYILSPKVFLLLLLDVTSCELCHEKTFLWESPMRLEIDVAI